VPTRTRQPRQVGNGGVLVHICAGIAALAIGVALDSLGRHVAGAASGGLRAESALFSVFETIRAKSLDHRASLVRVASCRHISAAFGATTKLHQRKQSKTSISMIVERIFQGVPIAAASHYGPTEEATHLAVLMLFVILANLKKLI
jgi:hypothetical protein